MSKDIIKEKDLKALASIQSFLMNFVMTPEELMFLSTSLGAKTSPVWDGRHIGVGPAQKRLHDINNAIRGEKTDYHVKGLTTAELFQIATSIGVPYEKAETNKKLLWAQICRKISPDISKEELRWIFAGLLGVLANDKNKDDVAWLKNNCVVWEDFDFANESWIKKNSATITDLEMRIEDVIGMTVNKVITNHHIRLTRADLLAVEKKLGIVPLSSQLISRGVIKLRIIKYIQDDVNGLLRQPSITRKLLLLKAR